MRRGLLFAFFRAGKNRLIGEMSFAFQCGNQHHGKFPQTNTNFPRIFVILSIAHHRKTSFQRFSSGSVAQVSL